MLAITVEDYLKSTLLHLDLSSQKVPTDPIAAPRFKAAAPEEIASNRVFSLVICSTDEVLVSSRVTEGLTPENPS